MRRKRVYGRSPRTCGWRGLQAVRAAPTEPGLGDRSRNQARAASLYYYPEEKRHADEVARLAERWYERFSKLFEHGMKDRQPLMLYASPADFEWDVSRDQPAFYDPGSEGPTEADALLRRGGRRWRRLSTPAGAPASTPTPSG